MKPKMFKYFSNLTSFYNHHPSSGSSDTGYIISENSATTIGDPGITWDSVCFIESEKLIWTHGEFFCNNELPTYSSSDNNKILSINSSGQLVWITPISIYTGSGEPANSLGNNGDIYVQS